MGGVVAYLLRANLRRGWRVGLGLALLVAVLGGVVLATAAGARRTSSAYDRLLDVANPPELLVSPPGGGPGFDPSPFYDALAEVPGVRGMRVFAGVPLAPEAGTPSARLAEALSGGGVLAVMAAVLALIAVVALTHLLLTSVRERRRELALLRTLGFSRWQLRASVGWHASVIALGALLVGAPLGIVLGRAVWRWYAEDLYAAAPPETPWTWLAVASVTTLVVPNLVAALPGRSAARTSPAIILREE